MAILTKAKAFLTRARFWLLTGLVLALVAGVALLLWSWHQSAIGLAVEKAETRLSQEIARLDQELIKQDAMIVEQRRILDEQQQKLVQAVASTDLPIDDIDIPTDFLRALDEIGSSQGAGTVGTPAEVRATPNLQHA